MTASRTRQVALGVAIGAALAPVLFFVGIGLGRLLAWPLTWLF